MPSAASDVTRKGARRQHTHVRHAVLEPAVHDATRRLAHHAPAVQGAVLEAAAQHRAGGRLVHTAALDAPVHHRALVARPVREGDHRRALRQPVGVRVRRAQQRQALRRVLQGRASPRALAQRRQLGHRQLRRPALAPLRHHAAEVQGWWPHGSAAGTGHPRRSDQPTASASAGRPATGATRAGRRAGLCHPALHDARQHLQRHAVVRVVVAIAAAARGRSGDV